MPQKSSKLKQVTLSFAVSKRTASSSSTGKKQATISRKPAASRPTSRVSISSDDEDDLDDIELPSSDEETEEIEAADSDEPKKALPNTRSTTTKSAKKLKESKPVDPVEIGILRPKDGVENVRVGGKAVDGVAQPELNEKDPKWRKLYNQAREKRGYMPLIHGEGQGKILEILRAFDMTYDFGPCVGVPRLERWERAKALGLNPPQEIYEILTTHEGVTKPEYSDTVLLGMVV